MRAVKLAIPEVVLIEPAVYGDERGFFFESYNQKIFQEITGLDIVFVQDNHSKSKQGVLRGLHYQVPPMAQGKLIRVTQGEVFDVAVDVRKNSATRGRFVSAILSAENKKQLWIPEGFAHGFLTMSDTAEVLYKTTGFYSQAHERSIKWDDETVAINWPIKFPVLLSEKDKSAPCIKEIEY